MSSPMSLNSIDWGKIGRGALIALAGAGVVFLTDITQTVDWGVWQPIAVAGASVIINILRKFMSSTG